MGRPSAFQIHQRSVVGQVARDSMFGRTDTRTADGTCVIDISGSGQSQFDEAQSYDMKQTAHQVISTCVMGPYKSGGMITGLGS